jgi:predicted DNA repair protein MutK
VLAVARGSLVNKAILVPVALAVSAWAPWAVMPLLMVGGAFLCFEGFDKLAHRLLHSRQEDARHHDELVKAMADTAVDLVTFEREKIKGAVRTDFILSAEIIAITLGTVATSPFATRLAVLSGIAVLMTVGVYGLVAAIVKLDDLGLHWCRRADTRPDEVLLPAMGRAILRAAPWLMKGLSIAGTAAMFLVGGGILVHGVPALHHAIEAIAQQLGSVAGALWLLLADGAVGMAAGAAALAAVALVQRLLPQRQPVDLS